MDKINKMDGIRNQSIQEFKNSRIINILGILGLFFMAACSGQRGAAPPDTVRVSQGSDIISFDPYYKFESPSICIQRNVFDPLTDTDASNKLVPCLAESWRAADPTHWEFKLRRGVKFHDGQPFTAADAAFSIQRARDWPLSRLRSEIPTIKGVQAPDPYTLVIETAIPDAILPLRMVAIFILCKESSEAAIREHGDEWLATHPNGTGPYRVKLWRKDDICRLEANPDYWAGAPAVKTLEFIPTNNDATRMAALRRGEYDVMVNVPPRYVTGAEAIKGYRIVKKPSLRIIYLGLDCGRDKSPGVPGSPPNPLKDLRVRRAVAAAIDNRLIVEKIMGGNAAPADQLEPEGVTGYDPALKLERPNIELAKKLLAEAGYAKGFDVRLDGPNDRYVNDAAIMQAVAAQLARVGLRVAVNAAPKAVFFTREEKRDCSFFLMGWANTNGDGAGTFDHLLHTPTPAGNWGSGNNSSMYSNPEIDKLAEAASKEFDPAKRNEILKTANRLAMSDLVLIPLHFQMDLYAVAERLEWTPRMETQVRGVEIRWSGAKKQ